MLVSSFLTPKSDVIWISARATMRTAFETMEESGFAALPVLDDEGRYVGALTASDLLRKLLRTPGMEVDAMARTRVAEVPMAARSRPVDILAEVDELYGEALVQNFVPVIDSRGIFVGIVRRSAILGHWTHARRPNAT